MSDHLAAELATLSPEQRRLLLQRLRGRQSRQAAADRGPRRRAQPPGEPLPLSAAQERFWTLELLSPRDYAYTVPFAVRVTGPLDRAAFNRALVALLDRHEALRTVFVAGPDRPRQRVGPLRAVEVPLQDLRRLPPAQRDEALAAEVAEHAQSTFDLAAGPPIALRLLRVGDDEHLLLVAVHHIVFDATSAAVVAEDLAALYDRAAGGMDPLPTPELQFADACLWEHERHDRVVVDQLPYWIERLTGAPPSSTLPADQPRAAAGERRAGHLPVAVPAATTEALLSSVRRERITLYAGLLTAFTLMLHRTGGQQRILVGVPTGSRTHPRLQRVVGCFYNPQALRVDLDDNPTLRALLHRAHQVVGEAAAHADVPFAEVVRAVRPARGERHNPLFQTMLSLIELPGTAWRGGGATFELRSPRAGASDMDLFLAVQVHRDGSLGGSCWFDAARFDPGTVQDSVDVFVGLLDRLSTDLEARVDDVVAVRSPAARPVEPAPPAPYRAPGTDTERILAAIWADVLGQQRVGVDDDFFQLGGDSMQAVQVVARATLDGVPLRPADLVRYPTVGALAAVPARRAESERRATATADDTDPENDGAPFRLTPAQAWFFTEIAAQLPEPGHFHHPYHLAVTGEVPDRVLRDAVSQLVRRHDALRLRVVRDASGVRQRCADRAEPVPYESHDLTGLPRDQQDAAAAAITAAAQTGVRLDGPLVRVEHLRLGPARPDRLLVVCHHLTVDGLSRPLVVGSLQRLVSGAAETAPPGASYREWAVRLHRYAERADLIGQAPFWLEQRRREELPRDGPDTSVRLGAWTAVRRALSVPRTEALRSAARAARIGLGDLLLAAVAQSVARWQGSEHCTIAVATPGRQLPSLDVDTARTVGWFQVFYPLRLHAAADLSCLAVAAAVRRQVTAVPMSGLGHGLLLQAPAAATLRSELAAAAPQVSFHHLGPLDRLGHAARRGDLLTPIDADPVPPQDPEGRWPYLLDFTGTVVGGGLRFAVHHSPSVHRADTVELLADAVDAHLREGELDGR